MHHNRCSRPSQTEHGKPNLPVSVLPSRSMIIFGRRVVPSQHYIRYLVSSTTTTGRRAPLSQGSLKLEAPHGAR
jgi:hypothetical protein